VKGGDFHGTLSWKSEGQPLALAAPVLSVEQF
jgi:hypothetical protein